MSWSQQTALARIEKHRRLFSEADVSVQDYEAFIIQRRRQADAAAAFGLAAEPVWRIAPGRAVVTHGVHVYANLVDFNAVLTEAGRETEASHERAMQFLHLHYGACDALIAAFDVQRVDFHGGRLHAVVLTPTGEAREAERVEKALAFSAALIEMVNRAGGLYGDEFRTRVRIGIDSGPAVAINGGSRGEPDPLFVGSPANHAAHLADGDEPGVYVSTRVRRVRETLAFRVEEPLRLTDEVVLKALGNSIDVRGSTSSGRGRLDEAYARFTADRDVRMVRPASFVFHYRAPPLRTLDFADHPPSRAVRLPLVSLFADIAGFTRYVDQSIAAGQVAQAVANLHVLRAEMADVVQKDFNGRKVRFIGDCLHGLIAEGDSRATDERRTIRQAVLAAGGVRSSVDLCTQVLPGLAALEGVAIGLEFGWTPACRIGLSGDASVRCSTSKATCLSETLQSGCSGRETAIGERAFSEADAKVRHLFGSERRVRGLNYAAALAQIEGVSTPTVARQPERMEAHARS